MSYKIQIVGTIMIWKKKNLEKSDFFFRLFTQ